MTEEVAIYKDSNIQITNLRAILHGKTYAMANVTSVSLFTQYANKTPGMVVALLGIMFGLMGLGVRELRGCVVFSALLLIVVGVAYYTTQKNLYFVRIGSASGEMNALESHDPDYIRRIVDAMNEAIVKRG